MIEKGDILAGRYKILETLGEGGMANVYLAEDIILQRKVAVKVLRMDLQNDPKTVQRFQREALATSELSHPNIVSILDVGSKDGMQYLVMEYVEGPNLKEYIQEHSPIPLTKTIEIMDQIMSAVALAHQHNVIHRDLKPQNILMDQNGNVKVADFGIAVALSQQSITQTNTLMGSVHYMSTEQARGSMATKQSDIYSLGIILYEMITGTVPFGGETAVSVALKHFQEDIPSIREKMPEVPQALENVVLKATAKDPRDRYDTVLDMKMDMDTSLSPERADVTIFVPAHHAKLDETIVLPNLDGEVTETKNDGNDNNGGGNGGDGKNPKNNRKKWWWIAGGIAALIAIIAILLALNGGSGKDVQVPNLTNLTQAEATQKLEAAGLKLGDIDKQSSQKIEEGKIIKTIPEKNMTVKEGSTIGIVVSSGPKKVTVPDVTGKKFKTAKAQLEKLGFTVSSQTDDSSTKSKNTVLKQSVEAGESVYPDETNIVLTISSGSNSDALETITMRDLTGYTLKSAQDYASENELYISSSEEYSDTVDKGMIISQNPAKGTKVTKGSNISVVVSKGKNNVVKKTYDLTYNKDSDVDGKGNLVQIYVGDDKSTTDSIYKQMYITKDTTVTIDLTLNNGDGYVRIVQDGTDVINEKVSQ